MTTTSDTRTKVRAVFFAFVMITSMVAAGAAFTGSVAATHGGNASVTLENSEPGASTNHNLSINASTDGASNDVTDLELDYDNTDVQSVGTGNLNVSYYNNSSGADPLWETDLGLSDASGSGTSTLTITLSSNAQSTVGTVSDGDRFTINSSGDAFVNPESGGEVNISIFNSDTLVNNQTATVDVDESGAGPVIGNSTSDADDTDASVNVSFADDSGVDEGSINVSVVNKNVSEPNTTTLVDNGEVVNGSLTDSSSLDDSNEDTENVNVTVELQEGVYDIEASASDTLGNQNTTSVVGNFTVNMSGTALKVAPDESGPTVGTNASVGVVAVDSNGNELTRDDGNVNAEVDDINLLAPNEDSSNYTINALSGDALIANTSYNATANVKSQVTELDLRAIDSSQNLDASSTVTQQYQAQIDDVDVSADDGQVVANGTDNETVSLQLVDANGEPIETQGQIANFTVIDNSSAVDNTTARRNVQTNESGIATIDYNASTPGQTVTVLGDVGDGTYSDTTTFETVSGAAADANSSISTPGTVQAGESGTVSVTINDSADNALEGVDVTLTSNTTDLEETITTNASGQASTEVDFPTETGDTRINASATGFSSDITSTTTVEVGPAVDLSLDPDGGNIAQATTSDITVQAVDQYGNLNASAASATITLNSSNTDAVSVDGSESGTSDLTNGETTFTLSAEGQGTATITASADNDLNSTNADWSVVTADAVEVTFENETVTDADTGDAEAANESAVYAQVVDADGNALSIENQQITITRPSGNTVSTVTKTNSTNASGVAELRVAAVADQQGETTIRARNASLGITGTNTITATGAPARVAVDAPDQITAGETGEVSFQVVDSEDRVVPIEQDTIDLITENGSFVDADDNEITSTALTLSQGTSEASANVTSDSAGSTVEVLAIASSTGVEGETTVDVQEVEGEVPSDWEGSSEQYSAIYENGERPNTQEISNKLNEWFNSDDNTVGDTTFNTQEISDALNYWFNDQ